MAILSALILLLSNSLVPNQTAANTLEEQEGFPNLVLVSTSTALLHDSFELQTIDTFLSKDTRTCYTMML